MIPTEAGQRYALGVTHSLCPRCRRLVPAKVVAEGQNVVLEKQCPEHGPARALVWRDLDKYLAYQRYVRPAWRPLAISGDGSQPCPSACGFCARHEQHLCLPIVEITTRCDLNCPVCLMDAGGESDLTLEQFTRILEAVLEAEGQIDVLNLSGGEPLLHPRLLELVDLALERPAILRVTVSTNGLRLARDPALLRELRERNVLIALQFDGLSEEPYLKLRGRPLLQLKQQVLDLLGEADLSTSLVMTAAAGVNDDQFGAVLDLLFSREHIVSLMVQPLAFTGRAASLRGAWDRLTLPEVIRGLGDAGHPAVAADDFSPLPCCHPLCFSWAYYLALGRGEAVNLKRLSTERRLLDAVANQVFFGLSEDELERLREITYELWSAPPAEVEQPQAVLKVLREALREMSQQRAVCGCFDPRRAFLLMERRVKSIFIHAFQDADSFDLARVRRCCNAYPQADGRLLPVCVRNNLPPQAAASDEAARHRRPLAEMIGDG